MAERFLFFNSVTGDPRKYQAQDFAFYFGSVLSTGLLHTNEIPGMKVSVEAGTLNTIVTAGKAVMKGHLYENTTPLTLTHSIPEPTLDRIDRVVLRLNLHNSERNILLRVLEGEPSENPIAPELTRMQFIHDISLAQIRVRANTVQLLPSDLVDERLNEQVCGLVYSLISIPTSQFQEQWDLFFENKTGEINQVIAEFGASAAIEEQKILDATAAYVQMVIDAEAQLQLSLAGFEQQWNDWFSQQQTEGFVLASEKGMANGVATLGSDGYIPSNQIRNSTKDLEQDREIAWLKLKQDSSDRVDGGTTFADDMTGNRFGMEFKESESENVVIRDGAMLMLESTQETVTVEDATVVNQPYSTEGNGGRKLVKLDNGWLVAAVKVVPDSSEGVVLQVSKDNGDTYAKLCGLNTGTPVGDISIAGVGNRVHVIATFSTNTLRCFNIDALAMNGSVVTGAVLDSGQSGMGGVSLTGNSQGTELHAAWSSKNSTYPNSFNIRYAKGIINHDGSVTWGAVEQVTIDNAAPRDNKNPCVVIVGNKPVIVWEYNYGTSSYSIYSAIFTGVWGGSKSVSGISGHTQSSPSAIFVPSEINGLPNGLGCVAWQGFDGPGGSNYYIRFAYTLDGGTTWSVMGDSNKRITHGSNPSLTANKNGVLFIKYDYSGRTYQIWSSDNGMTWSAPIMNSTGSNPSTLFDLTLNFTEPLFIYKGTSKVGFYGSWTTGTESPTLTGVAIYDLPSTDYVGAFVQKAGAVNVDAYINDVLMDADLESDEYMFEKTLPSNEPVKLRLELSRADTSGGRDDKVTRILGGIS